MGEPTCRPLTSEDLWLASDTLPGLLDGWCGPIFDREYGIGTRCRDEHEAGVVRGWYWFPGVGARGLPNVDICLDCRRPEIRDHARRVLLAAGHDIGPIIEAELRGDITPTEAAGLVWCSLLRVEVGLGVVGPPLTVEPDEGDLSEWLADGWTIWSNGALLMPLPDGVIGRLEVSDG